MVITIGKSRITKQSLLEKLTEEEVMSFYLGIIPDRDLHTNPLRSDRHPTASFYRSEKGELIFKDWKTGQHLNFIDVVMEKFKCAYGRAITIISRDFGLETNKNHVPNKPAIKYDGSIIDGKLETVIQAEVQDYTEDQIKWWLSFGITTQTLKKYNVFSVKNVFLNGNFIYGSSPSSPIYGYYSGKEDGRELWKMYFPIRTNHRFLLNHSKLQGVKQLPKTGDILVVTKSLKDVMVLHELGIPAIAPQAESIILNSRQYTALAKRFTHIIFNGDWDGAGQRFMSESRKRYPSFCLSFTNKKKYGKDISDYVKKHGLEKAKALIVKLRVKLDNGEFDYQKKYSQN